jgi:secondary thiamine-phosphate synthase enzyme
MHKHELTLATRGRQFYELTTQLQSWLGRIGARDGWLLLFLPHTSASLALQENADPDVQADLLDFLAKLVPDDDPAYRHRNEGPDDMSAHIRSLLGTQSLQVPVGQGRLQLGTWQGIFLLEHRQRAQARRITISFLGEVAKDE